MALDAINKIKQSEEQAKEILQKAHSDKNDAIKNSHKKAQDEYQAIIAESKNKADEIIQKAVEEGEKEAEFIYSHGKKEVEKLQNISDESRKEAINLVIEKVVKLNGNS